MELGKNSLWLRRCTCHQHCRGAVGRLTAACKHPTLESYYPTRELLPHRRATTQHKSYYPTQELLPHTRPTSPHESYFPTGELLPHMRIIPHRRVITPQESYFLTGGELLAHMESCCWYSQISSPASSPDRPDRCIVCTARPQTGSNQDCSPTHQTMLTQYHIFCSP